MIFFNFTTILTLIFSSLLLFCNLTEHWFEFGKIPLKDLCCWDPLYPYILQKKNPFFKLNFLTWNDGLLSSWSLRVQTQEYLIHSETISMLGIDFLISFAPIHWISHKLWVTFHSILHECFLKSYWISRISVLCPDYL